MGFLKLSYSNNRHAYGIIPIPIAVVARGNGPTVLLTAGNHGDEYEGMIALRNILEELEFEDIQGRVIFLPALNLPAVLADQRVSPLDGGNMNRAFPGNSTGGPTAMIADFIENIILPNSNYALDIHTGGSMCEFLPCGYIYKQGTRSHMEAKLSAAHAFGAPVTMVVSGTTSTGSLSAACERHNVVMVASELGGGGVRKSTVAMATTGVKNVLRHTGVLAGEVQLTRTTYVRTSSADNFVMSPQDGLFEPLIDIGQSIQREELVGRLHTVNNLEQDAVPIHANVGGTVIAQRIHPIVRRGDFVCHTGQPVEEQKLLTD